jgi:translocator protein
MILYGLMWIALIAVIIVNILSNALPLNGQTASEITNRLEVLFTPAGYVFSIWSLIYLLLIIWLVLNYRKIKNGQFKSTIGIIFIGSCILNIAWLFSWHYEQFALSVLIMFLLLISLIMIYVQYSTEQTSLSERLPFSFYLSWITVATIANVSYVLKYYNVDLGINEVFGSLILVVIAVIIGYLAIDISKDIYFVLVIVWGLIGIAVKTTNETMQQGTITLTVILVIAALIRYLFNQKTDAKLK